MSAVVRFHDGERFCVGLEASQGRKYRHLVTITDGGVRLVDVPLEQAVEVLGPARRRQLATFRRVGRIFGISQAAAAALDQAVAS